MVNTLTFEASIIGSSPIYPTNIKNLKNMKINKFTSQEDNEIIKAVKEFNTKKLAFKKANSLMPHHSVGSIQNRYYRVLQNMKKQNEIKEQVMLNVISKAPDDENLVGNKNNKKANRFLNFIKDLFCCR